MASTIDQEAPHRQFPCKKCGANLTFAPSTTCISCQYCGTENAIQTSAAAVRDSDYAAALAEIAAGEPLEETLAIKCSACGAETSLPPNVTADRCPFCGAAIVAHASSRKRIRPRYLLPFHITRDQALASFREWIASRWFAPSMLKESAEAGRLSGIYMPAWTYSCHTDSSYTGQRGDDYWVTERYTDTETYTENGRTRTRHVTKTRQVRKTRWSHASGRVANDFRDLLVRASESLPEEYFHDLEPWDLQGLEAYRDEYLAGFVCESYCIDVQDGFEHAKNDMVGPIEQTICSDIGGDHQRIDSVKTRYSEIGFKHILLPLWLSAYRYNNESYRFMVNARTGEVRGERPYSFWKIFLTAVAVTLVAASVAWFANMR